ncbi:NlpC/P60 family protein [Kitasatospora sp. NPDC094028]
MKKTTISAAIVVATACTGIFALLMTLAGAGGASAATPNGPGGGITTSAPVPDWLRTLIDSATKKGCPQVTPSLLAAQLYQESGFNKLATSSVGAQGIAQFMPATWATYGVDGDGDGKKDVWNPADAVPAAVAYDCALANDVKQVPGDSTDNMLAAYNAGPNAVIQYGGIPPFTETRDYVKQIRDLATKWAATGGLVPLPPGSGGAATAIAAAESALNTWYQWGGTCQAPFTGAQGCDCSSLMQMAWAAAGVNLPRTTYEQVTVGTPVASASQLAPGDLLFTPGSDGSAAQPGHVGMYIGGSQVIEAPHTGAVVRITPLSQWTGSAGPTNTVVAMRHIG